MSVASINGFPNVNFKKSDSKVDIKKEKTPEEIKEGKKKLVVGLAAAATVAVAGIAIAAKLSKGKSIDGKEAETLVQGGENVINLKDGSKMIKEKFRIGNVKCTDIEFFGPDCKHAFKKVSINDDLDRKTIRTLYMPKGENTERLTRVEMQKDSDGNVIKIIMNKYLTDSENSGGTRTITNIIRDKLTGKVISHNQEISQIAPITKRFIDV